MSSRPDREQWHLDGAKWVAEMADCTRLKVGAIIVDTNKRIAGAGYNGSYPGGPSCLKGECPRGRHYRAPCSWPGHEDMDPDFERAMGCMPKCGCGCGWPCPDAVAPGSSYDTGPGSCVAVHAEINALLDVADKNRLIGSTMYVNAAPCEGCLKILKNTAIVRIVWPEGEWVR